MSIYYDFLRILLFRDMNRQKRSVRVGNILFLEFPKEIENGYVLAGIQIKMSNMFLSSKPLTKSSS